MYPESPDLVAYLRIQDETDDDDEDDDGDDEEVDFNLLLLGRRRK